MKKNILLFSIILFAVSAKGQDNETTDFYEDIREYDLSFLWSPGTQMIVDEEYEGGLIRPEPIGYIGHDYQRFYIRFISVIRNNDNPYEYLVYGKTKVKDNICDFQGVLSVKKVEANVNPYSPEYRGGKLYGEYLFYEDKKQKGTGLFKGRFETGFILDTGAGIHYDGFNLLSDSYRNNQFEGIWKSYTTLATKKCNWGDYRIPDSRELDWGAAEFSPDPVQYKNGWENYEHMFESTPEGEAARGREKTEWWK